MFFPAILHSQQTNTRTVTIPENGVGTHMVYQDNFDSERTLSFIVGQIIQMAPVGRDVQEIKITMGG